jgi:hypothetical protein
MKQKALCLYSGYHLKRKSAMKLLKHVLQVRHLALVCATFLTGCASIVSNDTQELKVQVLCGTRPVRATCVAENKQGLWKFQAPGQVVVKNDMSELSLTCKANYMNSFTVQAPPLPSWGMAGNVLAGGLVGAAVDLYNNKGLKYPENIDITSPYCK